MNDIRIGFVGLGTMGYPICLNLIKNGYDVYCYDTNSSQMELIKDAGGICCDDIVDIGKRVDLLLMSLPNGRIVEDVVSKLLGNNDKIVTAIIDFSTISPFESKNNAVKTKEYNIEYYDCPVSGAVAKANDGTLTMMLGASEYVYNRYKKVLDCMAEKVYCMGNIGGGSTIKLINNYLIGVNEIAAYEMMMLADKIGLDLHVMFNVINNASGRSVATERIEKDFLNNIQYEKGFKIGLLNKDFSLMMDLSEDIEIPLLIGTNAQKILLEAIEKGYGDNNTQTIYKMLVDANINKKS